MGSLLVKNLRLLATIALTVSIPATVWSQRPVLVEKAPSVWQGQADILLTWKIRQVLRSDPLLRRWNLGVTVKDRVVTVWGSVPSRSVEQAVIERVESIAGVRDIRSDLFIEPPRVPPPAQLPPVEDRFDLENLPILPGLGQDRLDAERRFLAAAPRNGDVADAVARREPRQSTPWRTAAAKPRPTPAHKAFRLQTELGPPEPLSIDEQVRRLQASDPSYRSLQFRIESGRVYLEGSVADGADAHRLAQAVARLPGVKHVVLDKIDITP